MLVNASELRRNVYSLLDQVVVTGVPIEINRKGHKLLIVSEEKPDKLKNLKKRKVINDDPQKLVHIDWSSEWKI
jgi:prevent-host-death family protein